MNKKITREVTKLYIENGGVFCPFCGGSSIEVMETDLEAGQATVLCYSCHEEWKDIYKLVGISHFTGEIVLTE